MNLKDRRRLRKALKENGCLTEFKREVKLSGEDFRTIISYGGAFRWYETKKGAKFWNELSRKIPKDLL